jgi:hypothetical protein
VITIKALNIRFRFTKSVSTKNTLAQYLLCNIPC